MEVKSFIKKLRDAADTLENLFIKTGTEKEATAIRKSFHKPKKKYWTQTPKGRKIMSERMKKLRAKS